MRIGFRLLLGYLLIVAIAGYFILTIFLQEVRPTVRRATEGIMIDTANLLSYVLTQNLDSIEQVAQTSFVESFKHVNEVAIKAKIDGVIKNTIAYSVYITDEKGVVIFDTEKKAEGQDYSRWNDVYLTLQGKYGARTSLADPNDLSSSVMYVAAPLKIDNKIVGVLTVARSNKSMAMVVERSEKKILIGGGILISLALLVGLFFIWWINRSIKKLVIYANQVANHQTVVLPKLDIPELKLLASSLEDMRLKLEGKDYIEKYIHTLTHELKSPLASIRAATEILQDNNSDDNIMLPPEWVQKLQEFIKIKQTNQRFLHNIDQQTERMSQLIERMLELARLESRVGVDFQSISINKIINQVVNSKLADANLLQIKLIVIKNEVVKLQGDKFLLTQAINNLLTNAIDFTSTEGEIFISGSVDENNYNISIIDSGAGIPAYAIKRIYERFYSLPRPHKGKSSGLGLAFVKEVAMLHHGIISIVNREDNAGVIASLKIRLP